MIAPPMLFNFAVTLVLSFLPTFVIAHGYVQTVAIGGKVYQGFLPFSDPYVDPPVSRVIRKIPNDGPVLDIHDASLACNVGGETPTALVADAEAGSQVNFTMNTWPSDHLGPVSHYMASCNGDCTKFNTADAEWFKVDAAGYENGVWASTLLIENHLSSVMTIPASLKPGQYLIRHEIVALHDAGQPQYYPSCAQVRVTGSGTQTPPASDLVKIPGVYDSTQWPDIWSPSFHSFTIPGPPVAFSSGGNANASSEASSSAPASISTSHASAATSSTRHSSSLVSAPSPSPTGRCRRKRHASGQRSVQRHAAFGAKRHH